MIVELKKELKDRITEKNLDDEQKKSLLESCINDLKQNKDLMAKINPSTLSKIGNFFKRTTKGGKKRRNKTARKTKSRR